MVFSRGSAATTVSASADVVAPCDDGSERPEVPHAEKRPAATTAVAARQRDFEFMTAGRAHRPPTPAPPTNTDCPIGSVTRAVLPPPRQLHAIRIETPGLRS